jgi:hypothetical protein
VILEGVVTTVKEDGGANIAPMGAHVDSDMASFDLQPYTTSDTYANLKRTRQGVLHVTDDVDLIARAAVDRLDAPPTLIAARSVRGWILADACRWYAFDVASLDDRVQPATIRCEVVDRGRLRDFFGFNRAKHAVLEAAILATRADLSPVEQTREELRRLSAVVEKTAGPQERRAFQFLEEFFGETVGV